MTNKKIYFTAPRIAELIEEEVHELADNEVLTKTEYSVISGGTERACLLAMNNTSQYFPMSLGYSSVGYVQKVGKVVQNIKPGDRVLVYHGNHAKYNIRTENEITKVENESIDSLDASFVIIAAMGLGGVRKLELEIGESAMVLGQGLLGIFATQFLYASGAYPLIAADLNEDRRTLAKNLGADFVLDPSKPDFIKIVKEITKGTGVKATVEVTGVSAAMKQTLECASYMGRISLLGCTRVSDCSVDYYTQVHKPGVRLIGAHNFVRPKVESYPHHWTHHDDCRTILDMIAAGRIKVKPIVSRIVSPDNASEIYKQLAEDKNFPIGTVFDWRDM